MTEPTPTTPTPVDTVVAPVTHTMTDAQVQDLINRALAAGAAAAGGAPVGPAVDTAGTVAAPWSQNFLMHKLVDAAGRLFHIHDDVRAAHVAVDTHFPDADESTSDSAPAGV